MKHGAVQLSQVTQATVLERQHGHQEQDKQQIHANHKQQPISIPHAVKIGLIRPCPFLQMHHQVIGQGHSEQQEQDFV